MGTHNHPAGSRAEGPAGTLMQAPNTPQLQSPSERSSRSGPPFSVSQPSNRWTITIYVSLKVRAAGAPMPPCTTRIGPHLHRARGIGYTNTMESAAKQRCIPIYYFFVAFMINLLCHSRSISPETFPICCYLTQPFFLSQCFPLAFGLVYLYLASNTLFLIYNLLYIV